MPKPPLRSPVRIALALALILAGPPSAWADAVTDWNAVLLAAIRTAGTPPPAAARHLAIVHVAIFDAINAIDPRFEPYHYKTLAPRNASAVAAAAGAARVTLLALYPASQSAIGLAYQEALSRLPAGDNTIAGVQLGERVAAAILALRENDGSSASSTYVPGTQPGQWRPTISFGGVVRPPMLPHWGQVKPFAIVSGRQFRPPAPPDLASPEYAAEVNMIKAIGGIGSVERTSEQTEIAHFWAYGPGSSTPPGHWNEIAAGLPETRRLSLRQTARLFALLNIAMADAAIVSWDSKYAFNLWRPITAIQEADSDGNPATAPDPAWQPLLPTPPFPECTSGHSTFSGAAAFVLAHVLGADRLRFAAGSTDLPGVTRFYRSFSDAALESGMSRLYGGIHFKSANVYGLNTGAAVGAFTAWNLLTPLPRSGR